MHTSNYSMDKGCSPGISPPSFTGMLIFIIVNVLYYISLVPRPHPPIKGKGLYGYIACFLGAFTAVEKFLRTMSLCKSTVHNFRIYM